MINKIDQSLIQIYPNNWEGWEAKLIQRFNNSIFKIIRLNSWEKHLLDYLEVMKALQNEELNIKTDLEIYWEKISWLKITFPKIYDWLNNITLLDNKEEYFVYEAEYIEWEHFDSVNNELFKLIWNLIWDLLYDKYNIAIDTEMAHWWFSWNKFQIWAPNIKTWIIEQNENWEKILNLTITDVARSINEMPINTRPWEYID